MTKSVPPVLLALTLVYSSTVGAQEPPLDSLLRFEGPREGELLHGWGGGPAETIRFDSLVVHTGHGAARLERHESSSGEFSAISTRLPIDFGGQWIELRGFLRTEGVSGGAGLWLREDGPGGVLQFDNMQSRAVSGTTDWTEYSIRLPLDRNARDLLVGVLIIGPGTVWADDLQLLVDGRPIAEAPERVVEKTILDTDEEFAAGSGITVSALTEEQIEHVAVLGMVWGFLKYHHARIAAGEFHWDFELFRLLPDVLAAADRNARNRILTHWVDRLGVPETCTPCASAPDDPHLPPSLDWIHDTEMLGPALSRRLIDLHARRFSGAEHFYVSRVASVGNPVFDHELTYPDQRPLDAGFRILSLLRLWNIIQYWFPYRDQLDDDWTLVLREFVPRFVKAGDWDAYRLELLALITRVGDTHANLWSELDVRPPRGSCRVPVAFRFIEGRLTVTDVASETELEIGDVVETIDGRSVDSLIQAWAPYYSASNQPTRLTAMANALPRGQCGEGSLTVERRGEPTQVTVTRADMEMQIPPRDRVGETFQLLSEDVAYLKLSSVRVGDIPDYLQQASGTRGMVIDIRNYPSEFVVFALGSRLVSEPTAFARFTVADADTPGAFGWTRPLQLQPASPAYEGTVAILVDETSISQSEYTAMALRAGPRAVVVGSTTAGADGNVSPIPMPGGLRTLISGIGVFYPDKTPTQRVGIVPDIFVTPTIEGIRDGRDEVLEAALRHILGPNADEDGIRRMAERQ